MIEGSTAPDLLEHATEVPTQHGTNLLIAVTAPDQARDEVEHLLRVIQSLDVDALAVTIAKRMSTPSASVARLFSSVVRSCDGFMR